MFGRLVARSSRAVFARAAARPQAVQRVAPFSVQLLQSRSFCAAPAAGTDEHKLMVRKKRLMYHAQQRGWLELDVLIGKFAEYKFSIIFSFSNN